MGAYVSREYCENRDVKLSCEHDLGDDTRPETVGGFERGGFPANPDIAGIGVSLSTWTTEPKPLTRYPRYWEPFWSLPSWPSSSPLSAPFGG